MRDITKRIGITEYSTKSLEMGADFDLPDENYIVFEKGFQAYVGTRDSGVIGRVNGLDKLYSEMNLQVGDEIRLVRDFMGDSIFISKVEKKPEEPQVIRAESEFLENLFAGLDPIVHHGEYYFGERFEKPRYLAANKNWIITYFEEEGLRLLDENGETRIDLSQMECKDTKGARLWGINNRGVWFVKYKYYHENEIPCKIICISPWNNNKLEVKMNSKNAHINEHDIYIYDDQIYYISKKETKSYVINLLHNDFESELFVANKGEELSKLSVYGEQVSFKFVSRKEEASYWYFYSTYGFEQMKLEIPTRVIDINLVNLKQQVMWTEMTEKELEKLGLLGKKVYVARRLEPIQQNVYCTWKSNHAPAIFIMQDKYDSLDDCYFDGANYYKSPHYSELVRFNRDGEKFVLGPMGHGETQKIVVGEKYLYVNYDASMPVRLPRKFKSIQASAEKNQDALKLWGNHDYRL